MTLLFSRLFFTIIIFVVAYFALVRVWTKNVSIVAWFKKPSESIPLNPENENIPSIILKSSNVSHKEKLKDGQYNFDVKFKIANIGKQEVDKFKYVIFFTDKKEDIKVFEFETNKILAPYSHSGSEDIANLTNCSSHFLLKYPYCILYIEYPEVNNSKKNGIIFFRKIFYEKDKNLISTHLSFLKEGEERELIDLLYDMKKDYISNNDTFRKTLEKIK